ncbi:MAG TPA: hypothetical protein VM889_14090 [Candidatus Thermoplasmatota archaeon]|nr:hypothetical protein [Candidatus Thermoplasmatota archaeon]
MKLANVRLAARASLALSATSVLLFFAASRPSLAPLLADLMRGTFLAAVLLSLGALYGWTTLPSSDRPKARVALWAPAVPPALFLVFAFFIFFALRALDGTGRP